MTIIDPSSAVSFVITNMTQNMTGSVFLTLLLIFAFIMLLMTGFGLPLELSIPIVLPFVYVALLVTSDFIPVLGALTFYMAILLAKYIPWA